MILPAQASTELYGHSFHPFHSQPYLHSESILGPCRCERSSPPPGPGGHKDARCMSGSFPCMDTWAKIACLHCANENTLLDNTICISSW